MQKSSSMKFKKLRPSCECEIIMLHTMAGIYMFLRTNVYFEEWVKRIWASYLAQQMG